MVEAAKTGTETLEGKGGGLGSDEELATFPLEFYDKQAQALKANVEQVWFLFVQLDAFLNQFRVPVEFKDIGLVIRQPSDIFSLKGQRVFWSLFNRICGLGVTVKDVAAWRRMRFAQQAALQQQPQGLVPQESEKKGVLEQVISLPARLVGAVANAFTIQVPEETALVKVEEPFDNIGNVFRKACYVVLHDRPPNEEEAQFQLDEIRSLVGAHLAPLPRHVRSYAQEHQMELGENVARAGA